MWTEWMSAVGEWAIAGVIYYEIEENRISTFLAQVQSPDFYQQRSVLYEAYTGLPLPPDATIKQRAIDFDAELWKNEKLRGTLDGQWTNLVRLQYGVRRSLLHRNLIAQWFPQVMISIWAMSAIYIHSREKKRGTAPTDKYGYKAVRQSVKRMNKQGLIPITIYSGDGSKDFVISTDVLRMMSNNIDAPFA
jgi:hypothetical protein